MLITKEIEIKWNPNNKKYYEGMGYEYTNNGDSFIANVNDLSKGAHIKVQVKCDCCGKVIEKPWCKYLRQHDEKMGDVCSSCKHFKISQTLQDRYGVDAPIKCETFKQKIINTNIERYGVASPIQNEEVFTKMQNTIIEKYGVENIMQLKEFRDKVKQTNLEKYGVEYILQSKEAKEKSKDTSLRKYGCEYPAQSDEVKNKIKKTNLEKYGVECTLNSDEVKRKIHETCFNRYGTDNTLESDVVKEKIRQTCLNKYGVEHPLQSKEIRKKCWDTLHEHGNIPVSKQEIAMCDLLIEMYGEDKCFPSKLVDYYVLDCELNLDGYKIDIEYDGWTHREDELTIIKDKKRNNYLKHNNYKILRVQGNYKVPTKEQLKEAIDYLVKGNHSYTEIILDI